MLRRSEWTLFLPEAYARIASVTVLRTMLCGLLVCLALRAEDEQIMPDEVVGSAQVWIRENMDDWVFDFAGMDRKAVDQTLDQAQSDLAAMLPTEGEPSREDAEQILTVLRGFEETRPLAHWLESLLQRDRAPTLATNIVSPTPAKPTLEEMREFWLSVMTNRPAPPRASDYLTQIKPIFQEERVPAELVWLAEVESSFDPEARSPMGAVGLFQLMPETAQSLGLSTWFPDERQNAQKNARAAAQYLQHLHDRFGDWRLALAAYNAGPTRVSRLLKKSEVYSYDAIAWRLPSETRDYLAKVEAVLFIREGVRLASLPRVKG